jgi:signal transduction histidine kinase/CheY-like chemotaxis protein/streptogramin lyase
MSPAPSERAPRRAVGRRRVVAALLAIACCLPSLPAQQTDRPGFRVQQWQIDDGLPQATVTELMIGSDGQLWIATFGGLCKFDGERIRVLDPVTAPGMPSNRIRTLHEDRDGTLWIGTAGHGIARLVDGAWRPLADGNDYGGVFEIGADAAGRALVSCSEGLFGERDGALERLGDTRARCFDFLPVGDAVYAASETGLLRILENGVERVSHAGIVAMARRGDDVMVLARRGVGIHRDGTTRWLPLGLELGLPRDLLCDREGGLWIAGANGVGYVAPDLLERAIAGEGCTARTDLSLPNDLAYCLCEDPEGGIWVGFERFGLARLRRASVRVHALAEGLPSERLTTVVTDDDDTLLVTSRSGLMRRTPNGFAQVSPARRLSLLLKDSRGRVWLASDGELCILKDGGPVPFPLVQAPDQQRKLPAFGQLRTMVELPDGRLWAFGFRAILEIDDDGARVLRILDGLRLGALTRAVAAPDGAVWLGGPKSLVRVAPDHRQLRVWSCGDELPVGEVRSIVPEVGENAWVASYGGGILRIADGSCRAVDERHGLPDQSLCGLAPFGDAMLVAANRGCFVVARRDLLEVAAGRLPSLACRTLRAEGSLVAECNGGQQRTLSVDGNGHYWVCGVHGLYEFAPEWLQPRPRDLQPYVQQLVIGDTDWPHPEHAAPDAGARSLSLRLGVNAFDDHRAVRFRWRAPGIRPDWSAPSHDPEVRLDGLPSGEICVEAVAVDVNGTSSSTPLRVSFTLPERLWETTPFWVSAGLLAAGLIWLLVRAFSSHERRRAADLQALVDGRTRELVESRDRLEERVAERTKELRELLELSEREGEERQRLERELNDLRLSEAIGKLAGGVAHDFNNLLTVTLGSGELLEYEVESEPALELVRNIVAASTRGRSLTQHLLAVASRQVVRPEPLVLQDVLAELEPVLRPLLGEDTALRLDVADERAVVRGAVTQIEQILINLTANARDAIEGAGTVTISIDVEHDRIALAVRDDGAGMPDEVRQKAFEPFYTTKDSEGIGRGLGLATVFGIARQLGGDVEIESEVGRGTCVRVLLPRAAEAPTVDAVVAPPPDAVTGTVLLIEDQAPVREVLRRQLLQLGCTVETADDGDRAIAALANGLRVDLVVSDVVMPGLQGAALVEALRAQVPELPVLFVSGYMDGRKAHTDITRLGFQVLAKPVDARALAEALARHLPSRAR